MLPLDNIKVLDLTTRAPGPFCSMALGDLGADVLLVEAPPGTGSLDPPPQGTDLARAAAYNSLRRNKRSIVLDLKTPEARGIFCRLAAQADVLLEGFRPGVVQRLGVGYDVVKAINPRVVYCSITGYGQTGPYRLMPGHDINYISTAGVLGVIGSRHGPPVIPYNFIADLASGGLLSAVAILSALWVRERTGEGQYLDLSLTDGCLYLLANVVSGYHATGQVPRRGTMRLNGGSPDYQAYRCKDGKYLTIGAVENRFWAATCRALGRQDLIEHREAEAPRTRAQLQRVFRTKTRDQWFDLLAGQEVPVGKVYTVDELPSDPQLQARGMLIEVPWSGGPPVPQVGIAAQLRGTPGRVRWAGPVAGAHTRQVLAGLGMDEAEVQQLYQSGAVR